MNAVAWQQDFLCRCLGKCLYAEKLDSEIGDLIGMNLPGREWFSYVRYDKSYGAKQLKDLLHKHPNMAKLDAIIAIPTLQEIGQAYAEECVKLEHII